MADVQIAAISSTGIHLRDKLNARDSTYIAPDIRDGTPIKVPNDFTAFKTWTPLDKLIPDVADLPKFILIVILWSLGLARGPSVPFRPSPSRLCVQSR